MISSKQMELISQFAIDIDWNLAFGGKAKGNRHLFRIVGIAKQLALSMQEAGESINTDILEAGAWLHDTNLENTIAGDTLSNKEKVSIFLKSIDIAGSDMAKIIHCIEAHDGRVIATTMESKIVHDADTLEKMGPLGVIRETWKRSQLGWTTEQIAKHLPTHLAKRQDNLYTNEAKKKANELNDSLGLFFSILQLQLKET